MKSFITIIHWMVILGFAVLSCTSREASYNKRNLNVEDVVAYILEDHDQVKTHQGSKPLSDKSKRSSGSVRPCVDPHSNPDMLQSIDVDCVPLTDPYRDEVLKTINTLEKFDSSVASVEEDEDELGSGLARNNDDEIEKKKDSDKIAESRIKQTLLNKRNEMSKMEEATGKAAGGSQVGVVHGTQAPVEAEIKPGTAEVSKPALAELISEHGMLLDPMSTPESNIREQGEGFFDQGQFASAKFDLTEVSQASFDHLKTERIEGASDNILTEADVRDKIPGETIEKSKNAIPSDEKTSVVPLESIDRLPKVAAERFEDSSNNHPPRQGKFEPAVESGPAGITVPALSDREKIRLLQRIKDLSTEAPIDEGYGTDFFTKQKSNRDGYVELEFNHPVKVITDDDDENSRAGPLPDDEINEIIVKVSDPFEAVEDSIASAPRGPELALGSTQDESFVTINIRLSSVVAAWAAGFFGTFFLIAILAAYLRSVERKSVKVDQRDEPSMHNSEGYHKINMMEVDFSTTKV